eukprot:4598077-Amphidinium_carterae.1
MPPGYKDHCCVRSINSRGNAMAVLYSKRTQWSEGLMTLRTRRQDDGDPLRKSQGIHHSIKAKVLNRGVLSGALLGLRPRQCPPERSICTKASVSRVVLTSWKGTQHGLCKMTLTSTAMQVIKHGIRKSRE